MGQKEIYSVIKELGGTAFPQEIKQVVKSKYPNSSMHDYVYHQLKNLERWRIVEKNLNGSWTITAKY